MKLRDYIGWFLFEKEDRAASGEGNAEYSQSEGALIHELLCHIGCGD